MNPSIPSAISPLDELTIPRHGPPGRYRGVDRRRTDSYRLPLQREIVDTELGTVEIQDLSVGGTGLLIGSADPRQVSGRSLHIPLGPDAGLSARLEVVRTQWDRDGLRIGTRFVHLDRESLNHLSRVLIPGLLDRSRQFSHILGGREPLMTEGPRRIARLFHLHGIADGRLVQIFEGESRLPASIRLHSVERGSGRSRLVGQLVGNANGLSSDVLYTCVLPADLGVHYFTGRVTEMVGDAIHLELPEQLWHAGFRDSFRGMVSDDRPALVSFRHPREERDLAYRPVIDVGARGFSFHLAPDDLLFPGERLSSFRMKLPDSEIRGEAMMRGVWPRGGGGAQGGAEIIQLADRHDALRWHRYVLEQIDPAMELRIQDTDARFWQVLEASGYVKLWGSDARRLEASFADSWSQMPSGCGKLMLLHRNGEDVAGAAASLQYPRTWLFHHVGVAEDERSGNRRRFMEIGRELFRGILYTVQHVDPLDYFMAYMESGRGYGNILFRRFAKQLDDASQVVCLENSVFKGDPMSGDPPDDSRRPVEIAEADDDQLREISRHLRDTVPQLQYEAMAYAEDEIQLERFSEDCSKLGYERTRHVLVALEGGAPVAAMFVELGSEGVNIFGLLNACWFVDLTGGDRVPLRIRSALMRRAKRIYRRAGKSDFILFQPAGSDRKELCSSGVQFVSGGIHWIARPTMVPAWRSYVDDFFGIGTL